MHLKHYSRTITREVTAQNKWTRVTREQFWLNKERTRSGEYLVVERDPAHGYPSY